MSENNTLDSYETGYGKPPRSTQFRKGVSGNPKGRPKDPPEFDRELLREAKSLININENGRSRRISKHAAVVKQVTNKAAKGDMSAARTYFGLRQVALERFAQKKASQSNDTGKYNVNELSDEELMNILAGSLKDKEQERENGHISNPD
jgi:Family of unknown function (DUF5681)